MPRTPESTTEKPEKAPEAPKLYGFDDAFDATGQSIEDIVQSGVSNTGTKVNYGQSGKRVESALKQFRTVGGRLFEASRLAHARTPDARAGRAVESIDTADAALPGINEYIQLARNKVDAHVSAGYTGDNLKFTDDEQLFVDALEWSALREKRLATPPEITALDYQGSPHEAPYDSYDNAQHDAVQQLIDEAIARRDAAAAKHDSDTADDQQRVIDELETYRDAFVDFSSTHAPNRQAASEFGDELLSGSTTDASRNAMNKQKNLDRIFATFDGQVKSRMKEALDVKDLERQTQLETHVNHYRSELAAESASKMRSKGLRRNAELGNQHDYDIACELLGRQELRIAQRIGIPGTGTKLPQSGPEVNAFLATNHIDRAKALDAKILRELDEKRTFADKAADFWAGKNNGEKEKNKTTNFVRRTLKMGAFAAMALTGPAGVAIAAGTMIGAGKLSKYTSKHAHELRTRSMDSLVDERDLMEIVNAKNISSHQKIQGLRILEQDRRNKDILSQQRRTQIAYGKTALWAAGVSLAPVYAPTLAHIGAGIAENSWELAKWSGSRL